MWMEWFSRQWERPDRTDNYIRQATFHLMRSYAKHPGEVKWEDTLLRTKKSEKKEPENLSHAAAIMKAVWVGRMGMPVEVVSVSPSQVIPTIQGESIDGRNEVR